MSSKKIWGGIILVLVLLAIYQFLFPLPPQTNLIRYFALAGFFLLSFCLIIGPAVVCFGEKFAPLMKHRRRIGVLSFIFVAIHFLLVFVYSFGLNLSYILAPAQILLGAIALVIMFLLGITSFDKAMQKMGYKKWKLLQRFVYLAFALSFIHFIMDANGLFLKLSNGTIFLNLAEAVLIAFGAFAICMQFAGFCVKIQKSEKIAK